MKATKGITHSTIIWGSWLRLTMVGLWFIVMSFAAYYGLIVHAFIGFAALTVLTYMIISQANARINYLKKKRARQLSHYFVGEDYMEIFDSKRRQDL